MISGSDIFGEGYFNLGASARLVKSFGATRVLFSYLEQLEVLLMQNCNKWFYNVGVGRIQTRLLLLPNLLFVSNLPELKIHELKFPYNRVRQRCYDVADGFLIDHTSRFIQTHLEGGGKSSLYVMGGRRLGKRCLQLVKSSGITGFKAVEMKAMMPGCKSGHAVCSYKHIIYVSGGHAFDAPLCN